MYKSVLVLFNISKSRNFGGMMRTADALGVSEIIIVGRKKFSFYGNFGTINTRRQRHFYTLSDAKNYLYTKNYDIVGVEINAQAKPIDSHPFKRNSAFLLGNEGSGLTENQLQVCDYFVYIKQFGQGASLNVNVATGIVLHQFATWAKFTENKMIKQKFIPS